jgi:hypothetical protein
MPRMTWRRKVETDPSKSDCRGPHSRGLFVRTSRALGSLNKTRLANPRPVLQREVNSAGGIDLCATFPASVFLRLDHEHLAAQLNHEALSGHINGLASSLSAKVILEVSDFMHDKAKHGQKRQDYDSPFYNDRFGIGHRQGSSS